MKKIYTNPVMEVIEIKEECSILKNSWSQAHDNKNNHKAKEDYEFGFGY